MGYFDEAIRARDESESLEHHGILGQKWGVRRFESKSGHLTSAGKSRYYGDSDSYKASNGVKVGAPKNKGVERFRKFQATKAGGAVLKALPKANAAISVGKGKENWKRIAKQVEKETDAVRESEKAHKAAMKGEKYDPKAEQEKKGLSEKQKKAIKIGAAVAATAVAAYGGYKLYQLNTKATEGISKELNAKALANYRASSKLQVKGFGYHDEGFKVARSSGADTGNKLMGLGKNYFDQASLHKDLADEYRFRANSKKYSVKDKYNYLKNGKVEDSALAKLTRSAIQDKQRERRGMDVANAYRAVKAPSSVKDQKSSLQWQAAQMKGAKTFIDASKRNDDLVQELLKKNTLKF